MAQPDLGSYRHPASRKPLEIDGTEVVDADGLRAGTVDNGFIRFLTCTSAESDEDRAKLEDLNQKAAAGSWRDAIASVYDPGFLRYVTDEKRARFLDLLPLSPGADVLEIGTGLGQFTIPIARRVKKLFALEVIEGQARFVAGRVRQDGLDNVEVAAGGADCRLPYRDERFDLVVLNLVFEWCGARSAHEPHEMSQKRLLQEIHRVLRPGGQLYLVTKNRFALNYLLGKPDEHFDGMRFGSALPRWLAKLLHRRRPSGWLHSYRGLKRMVRAAGFQIEKSWWAAPEMRFPSRIVELTAPDVREARKNPSFRQGASRSENLLMRLVPDRLVGDFAPGISLLLQKPQDCCLAKVNDIPDRLGD